MPAKRPGWFRRIAFGAATALIALLALEGVSRLGGGGVDYPRDPLITRGHLAWKEQRRYDPLLFWSMLPNRQSELGGTNSLGLRGPEIAPKRVDEFRVLSLGESTTYGWKLPYEDCYSAMLEADLQAASAPRARVINAGVPGHTIFQGWVYLEHRGLQLHPDAVLLYFGLNDFLPIVFREQRDSSAGSRSAGLTDRQLFLERRRLMPRLLGWTYERSNLVRGLGAVLDGASHSQPETVAEEDSVDLVGDAVRVPEKDRWDALLAIRDLCANEGVDLVIVIPWYRDFERHAPLLRRFATEFVVPVVDLPALLSGLPQPRANYFQDPIHPNRDGQRVIATAILGVVGNRWSRAVSRRRRSTGRGRAGPWGRRGGRRSWHPSAGAGR